MRARSILLVAVTLAALVVACATPGIPAGNPQKGFVVWGFLGQGPTTAVPGQAVSLVDASGRIVQTTTSDGTGKYVLAYHPPGQYVVQVGSHAMQIQIGNADQRLDIDLSNPSGQMSYAAAGLRAQQGGAAGAACPATAPSTANPGEQRDPALVGSWSRENNITSGDAFMSTRISLLVCEDGSFVRRAGDTVGGGGGWHMEGGSSDGGTRGRWRTEGNVVLVDDGTGWVPYARYYVEGNQLLFTFSDGSREVWKR
jgi:hypothetical protein